MKITIEKVNDLGDVIEVQVNGESFVIRKEDLASQIADGESIRRVALTVALSSGLPFISFEGREIWAFEPVDIAQGIGVRIV